MTKKIWNSCSINTKANIGPNNGNKYSINEKIVIEFYDIHAQYLKQWVPKAPKPIENSDIDEEVE